MKFPWLWLLISLTVPLHSENVVDQLSQAQLQEIFQRLQSSSLNAPKLTDEELNRAAVQGLLQRLGPGFAIAPKTPSGNVPTKLVAELLSPEIAYLRPANFQAAEATAAGLAMDAFAQSTATTLVLDLRSPAPPANAVTAQQWLSLFLPEGTALFKVRTVGQPAVAAFQAVGKPRWTQPVLVLIDAETNNAAEALAAVLQRKRPVFLIGTATLGQAIGYRSQSLTENLELRWAEQELLFEDDTSLFNHGLKPDLETPFDLTLKVRQFLASETTSMKRFAFETERPRLNEAALVARTNPELEYRIAKSAHATTAFDAPAARDPVLQQALDYLTAQAFLKTAPVPETTAETEPLPPK